MLLNLFVLFGKASESQKKYGLFVSRSWVVRLQFPTSPVTLPAPFFFTGSIVQVPCSLFHFATFFSVPTVSFPVPGPFCQILSTLFISCWLNRPHHRLLGIGSFLEARRRRVCIAGRSLERERVLVWLWCSCSALLVLSSCHLLPRILLSKALTQSTFKYYSSTGRDCIVGWCNSGGSFVPLDYYCDWCRLTIGEPSCCIPGHFGHGRFFPVWRRMHVRVIHIFQSWYASYLCTCFVHHAGTMQSSCVGIDRKRKDTDMPKRGTRGRKTVAQKVSVDTLN